MLSSLRSIVQELNATQDLESVLTIIVRRVRETMATQVCSIYLHEEKSHAYTLMATEGLNPESVGQVSLSANRGLVGLVASREEAINLDDAEAHPNFEYFPETGEERYSSFLGVPIIHHRAVLGVLVVQQTSKRRFDEGEEAFLITMSAQLAGIIAHAEVTGALVSMGSQAVKELKFVGIAGAQGVAIGDAVVVTPLSDLNAVPLQQCDDVDAEIRFFNQCLAAVREDVRHFSLQLEERLNKEEQMLFEAYASLLDDAALGREVIEQIKQGYAAQYAWSTVIGEHVKTFQSMSDPYFRERATDVQDLGRRVLAYLQQSTQTKVVYPDATILVGEDLTASDLAEVPKEKLVGLISVKGSGNSHVAILARSMGIPTVMGAVDLPFTRLDGRHVIVDGYHGHVYSDPGDQLLKHYQEIAEEDLQMAAVLDAVKDLPSETLDNHRVSLWVNTGLIADAQMSLDRGAEGVGLFRTEVPFMLRDRFPSEEEQRAVYREQLEAFAPHPVTMRTLDIGGDKSLPYFPIQEDNPFLGWRGIRVTLDHPEIFLSQTRAMLKASEGLDNLRILLPMVSTLPELEIAQMLVNRAFMELIDEGFSIQMPQIGVMVEVPSAVYQAREFAAKADFLSVGSNDLTQYLLAVDRNNPRVADLYGAMHPAVLRALQQVVDCCRAEGKPVSICGEMAGDPKAALLLVAMGFDVLSMSASGLLKVKSVLRGIKLEEAKELLDQVMALPDAESINICLDKVMRRVGLGRIFNPGAAE